MRVEQEYAIFGQILKKHRKKNRFSQSKLGELVDLDRASIANIESGNQRILLRDALIFSKTLGFSLDEVQIEVNTSKLESMLSQQSPKVKTLLESIITVSKERS